MSAKIHSFILLTGLAFILSGCVAPVVENYTAFQDTRFDAREKPAELFKGNVTDLMQSGYLLIGYIDFTHNIQICYENDTCSAVSKNVLTQQELLKHAAQRGADRVQLLYSSLQLTPKTLSICTSYTTTSYTDKNGNIHFYTVCASYANYKGNMESWNKRALLWRYEPAQASADNNYLAVEKAYAILHQDEKKNSQASADTKNPLETDKPIAANKNLTKDLYGAQLVTAIENGNLDFLHKQLNTDKLNQWQEQKSIDLLTIALQMKQVTVYRWLIDQQVDWDKENTNGYSALEYAIAYAQTADVAALLNKHPQLSSRFNKRDKIYNALAASSSPEMIDYLVKNGFSINGRVDKFSLLSLAIINDNDALALHLLERHAKIGPVAKNTPSSLTVAVIKNNYNLTSALVGRGAHINKPDQYGNTALHYAASYSSPEIVKLLITHGAKLNVFNKDKFSPLYMALVANKWNDAGLLMQQGKIDYTIPSVEAFTYTVRGLLYQSPPSTLDLYLKKTGILYYKKLEPLSTMILEACAENCNEEKMSVFFDNGVNVHYAPGGKSLFHTAYEKKNIGALTAMVKHGYHPKKYGKLTPLQRALIDGDEILVKAYRLADIEDHELEQTAEKLTDKN